MRAAHDAFEALMDALAAFDRVHGELLRSMKAATAPASGGGVELLQREDALHACVSAARSLGRHTGDLQHISRRLVHAARHERSQDAPAAPCMSGQDLALASRTLAAECVAEARKAVRCGLMIRLGGPLPLIWGLARAGARDT